MTQIERLDVGNVSVLRLEGDLDESCIESLRDRLFDCMSDGRFNIVLNLKEVRYVSYMALGIIVERLRKVRACRGDIKLSGTNLYMDRLLRMVGVTALFETYDTEAQAVGVFQEAA